MASVDEKLVPGPQEDGLRETEDKGLPRLVGALHIARDELGHQLGRHALERKGWAREDWPYGVDHVAVAGRQERAADAHEEDEHVARDPDAPQVAEAVHNLRHGSCGEPGRTPCNDAVHCHGESVKLETLVEGEEDGASTRGSHVAEEPDKDQPSQLRRGKDAEVVPRPPQLPPAALDERPDVPARAILRPECLREEHHDKQGIQGQDH
mmetsp:Transcript_40375/g.91129  ORF Transcript_40375/g.91129 Transcript_40375/m.91129 type:complete len:209 (+) Transcript_40375:529-1155(+)